MTIRIGIIGSGFALQHAMALKQIPEAELVAVCARSESKAQAMLIQSTTKYYEFGDYRSMLRQERLDAAYICVPPFLHGDLELACAEHVAAVFVEKPIGLDLESVARMQEAFGNAGTLVSVGYMNRYRSNIQMAKQYFKADTPILFNAAWCGLLPPPYWWRQQKMSGGQLTEQATHLIDAIRFIAGEVEEVSAYANRGYVDNVSDFNVDEATILNVRLRSGAIGNIMTSCFSKDHGGGALGIFLNISSCDKTYRFSDEAMDLNIQESTLQSERFDSLENPILAENKAFINAIKNRDASLILSSYQDATKSLKVSVAAELSLREQRPVKLSELDR